MTMSGLLKHFSLPLTIYFIYSLVIACFTFVVMGYDKFMATKNLKRVPEVVLLFLAFIGGAVGELMGMVVFHHKISKKKFYIGVPVFVVLNIVFAFLMLYYYI